MFVLLIFVATSAVCFGTLRLFMRSGTNEESEAPSRGRRALLFGAMTHALAGVLPVRAETRRQYARLLRQAGHYHSEAATEFLALRNALLLGAALLTVATIVAATEPGTPEMYQVAGGGLLAMMLAYAVPRLALESMAKRRSGLIGTSLPDAMDMITMCTSAGLPLHHAIARVADEMRSSHPDLSYELRLVGRHADTGSLTTAMQHFAERLDIPEVHSVNAMIWQAENQGASVAAAFHAFADQVRLERRQRAEESGNKASFKMLFPLVFCLVPAVYLVLLGPAALDIRDFFRRERQPGGALSREGMASVTGPQVDEAMTGRTGVPGGASPSTPRPAAQ